MAAGSTQAWGLTILRVVVGIVFLVHGYQKLFHMGFHGVAGFFGHLGIPLPMVFAVIVTLVEFVGGRRRNPGCGRPTLRGYDSGNSYSPSEARVQRSKRWVRIPAHPAGCKLVSCDLRRRDAVAEEVVSKAGGKLRFSRFRKPGRRLHPRGAADASRRRLGPGLPPARA
jgi:uncharacterized membrane protein YhdT